MEKNNIIDSVIPTKRSRELVRIAIPILIRWAKLGLTDKNYGDMIHALGYTRYSGIGLQLGYINDVINELSKVSGKKIPSLNNLCKDKKTKLPSDGFSYVYPTYHKMKPKEKVIFVRGLDAEACNYPNWDWVLDQLELQPAKIFTDKEIRNLAKHTYGKGGEGKEHKLLKEYIAKNPSSIGIKSVKYAENEYDLPSGDRLDVFFELKNGNRIAIEVKPSTSPTQDITRGIFQCVKYKAVMEALRTIEYSDYESIVLLVITGEMSEQNKRLAEDLGINYIENFKLKN